MGVVEYILFISQSTDRAIVFSIVFIHSYSHIYILATVNYIGSVYSFVFLYQSLIIHTM